jgi:hypothetical protein
MVRNFGPSGSDFKRLAKTIARTLVDLERTKIEGAKDGFCRNQWGTYWSQSLIDRWLAANERFCNVEKEQERSAARLSRALFLISLNRLDEAEREVHQVDGDNPKADSARALAIIFARRGDLTRAREMATRISADPATAFFRISDDELQHEYEIGKAFW